VDQQRLIGLRGTEAGIKLRTAAREINLGDRAHIGADSGNMLLEYEFRLVLYEFRVAFGS